MIGPILDIIPNDPSSGHTSLCATKIQINAAGYTVTEPLPHILEMYQKPIGHVQRLNIS